MNMVRDIKSVTCLKAQAAELLKQVNETRQPVIITQNGEPKAVLQDPQSYENMRNTLGLLKLIALGEQEVRQGEVVSQHEVFAQAGARLKAGKNGQQA